MGKSPKTGKNAETAGHPNQFASEFRDIATIGLDYSKLSSATDAQGNTVPPNIKAANAVFNEAVREARGYILTERGAAMLPGTRTGANGEIYKDINLTSPNNNTYFANLKRELDNLLDARKDGSAVKNAVSIDLNRQKYNTVTAEISKELREVFKEKTASVPLAEFAFNKDRGLTTLKIPEGAKWAGAKGTPVDAMASARSRILAERKDRLARKSVETEQEERYFKNAGMDAEVYRAITDPKEKRNLLTYVNKINRDLMAARNPDLAVNLARASAAKSAGVGDALSFMVLKDPMMELSSQDAGRLNVPAKTARKLAFEQAAYEEKYVNTDTGKKARFRALDIRQKNREYDEEWIKSHPDSAEAKAGRVRQRVKTARAARGIARKAKRAAQGAAHLARNTLVTLIRSILATTAAGVFIAGKTLSTLLSVGETVRQRNLNDLKLNLAPGTNKAYVAFAKDNGLEEDALVKALGGLYGSFGTVINFSKTNLDPWVMLLGQDITKLMSMFDGNGDVNTVNMMNGVMDTLLRNAQQRIVDVTKQGGKITEEQAMGEQIQLLSPLNQGLASMYSGFMEMFQKYRQDVNKSATLEDYKQYLLGGAKAAGYSYDSVWEAYITQGHWNPGEGAPPKPPDRAILDIADRQALDNLRDAVSSFSFLKEDVFAAIRINTMNLVNLVRSILNDFIRPFFPAFAQREDERAAYVNEQSRQVLEQQMPVLEEMAMLSLKNAVPEDKIPAVISALQTFERTKDTEPLLNTGLSDGQMRRLTDSDNFYNIHAYLKGLSAQALLDELKDKGDKRAYMVTEEIFAEQNKLDSYDYITKLYWAMRVPRSADPGRVGRPDIFYSGAEAEDALALEQRREQNGERIRARREEIQKEETRLTIETRRKILRENRERIDNTLRPASETDVSGFPKKDGLFSRPNQRTSDQMMNVFKDVNTTFKVMLEDGSLYASTSLGSESFNDFMDAAQLIFNSSLFKAELMPGKEQKKFFDLLFDRYNKLREKYPEETEQVTRLRDLLDAVLATKSVGEVADAETLAALSYERLKLPKRVPPDIADAVEEFFNTDSPQMIYDRVETRRTHAELASSVNATPDMAAFDVGALKQRVAQEIVRSTSGTLSDILGGANDGRTMRLYKEKGKGGDLNLTISVPGQPDTRHTIRDVMGIDQDADMRFDTPEDYMNWAGHSDPMPAGR